MMRGNVGWFRRMEWLDKNSTRERIELSTSRCK
jgi:hypothetical protein